MPNPSLASRPSFSLSRCGKSLLRRLLNRSCAAFLRVRALPLNPPDAGSLVIIAPHADDETLGCGGMIARRRREGREIHVIYVSDGGASHPDIPRHELAAARQHEATQAMSLLGVPASELTFIGARDGQLDRLPPNERARGVEQIRAAILRARSREIFTPCQADGSTEHAAVFAMVMEAVGAIYPRPRVLQYPVWSWWNPRFLIPTLFAPHRWYRFAFPGQGPLKRQALACYRSQVEALSPGLGPMLSAEFLHLFSHEEEFFLEA